MTYPTCAPSQTHTSVGLGIYGDASKRGSELDAVVAYSMPVLQLAESVDSMKEIKDIGERAKEEKGESSS